jgi:hypothetical protein
MKKIYILIIVFLCTSSVYGFVWSGISTGNNLNATNGINGINGVNGTNGINGVNGTNGINGVNGTNGHNGNDGTNGINGINGINGTNGINGINGTNGINGVNGTNAYNITINLTNNITNNLTNNITNNITNNLTNNITNNVTNNITNNITSNDGTGGWVNDSNNTQTTLFVQIFPAKINISATLNVLDIESTINISIGSSIASITNLYNLLTPIISNNSLITNVYDAYNYLSVNIPTNVYSNTTIGNMITNENFGLVSGAGIFINISNVIGVDSLSELVGASNTTGFNVNNTYQFKAKYTGITSSGNPKNNFAFYIAKPSLTSSSLLNNYGIYIADQNVGTINDYAIYTNLGKIRFGDKIIFSGNLTANDSAFNFDGVTHILSVNSLNVTNNLTNNINASYIVNSPWITNTSGYTGNITILKNISLTINFLTQNFSLSPTNCQQNYIKGLMVNTSC